MILYERTHTHKKACGQGAGGWAGGGVGVGWVGGVGWVLG